MSRRSYTLMAVILLGVCAVLIVALNSSRGRLANNTLMNWPEAVPATFPLSTPLSAPLTAAVEPDPAPTPIRIRAVGDIMLSRTVGTRIARSRDNASPFSKTADFLAEADITMGNLESPFSDQGPPIGDSGMVFKAAPNTIEGLTSGGFDLVTLANNHFGNAGAYGMTYTFDHLRANNIEYVGAGRDEGEAHALKVLNVHPVIRQGRSYQIGFLGYEDIAPAGYEAGANSPGTAWANPDEVAADVTQVLAESDLDYLIVTIHWGVEYTPTPNARQRDIAHAAIDAGADMIIGHHPHVVQETEWYQDKLIIYSLGNFVFDQMWSTETQQGVIADIVLTDACPSEEDCHAEPVEASRLAIESIDFIPIRIYDYNQPDFITDEAEIAEILGRMGWEGK